MNPSESQPKRPIDADSLRHTIVTAHLQTPIPKGKNIVWCNTFQLAWNELCDLAAGPIEMDSPPDMVAILNKREASKDDLDAKSYLAIAGLARDGIYERIREELKMKFQGQADPRLFEEIPRVDWVAYAYLCKQLSFRTRFTRMSSHIEFDGTDVDAFGINQFLRDQVDEVEMASQVIILDYKNPNHCVVELMTRNKSERLILAMLAPRETLAKTIDAVETSIADKKTESMREMEDLFIPVVEFDLRQDYRELLGKPLRSSNRDIDGTEIVFAAQSIRFRLDETGTVLESEGGIAGGMTPRRLVFDKPFLILLKRRDAKRPYFALWVGNAELLVSTPVDTEEVDVDKENDKGDTQPNDKEFTDPFDW